MGVCRNRAVGTGALGADSGKISTPVHDLDSLTRFGDQAGDQTECCSLANIESLGSSFGGDSRIPESIWGSIPQMARPNGSIFSKARVFPAGLQLWTYGHTSTEN
jgi:hypothetical protein